MGFVPQQVVSGVPLIRPMLATLGELPPISQDAEFGYELKWHGIRATAYVADGGVRLLSRNDRDVTVAYPELAVLPVAVRARRLILDGEIVALEGQFQPAAAAHARARPGEDPDPRRTGAGPLCRRTSRVRWRSCPIRGRLGPT